MYSLAPPKFLHPGAVGKIDGCHHRVAAGVEGTLSGIRLVEGIGSDFRVATWVVVKIRVPFGSPKY